jgi:hypothetical protein
MPTELQKTLEQLHAELNRATTVDAPTRELLATLAGDIQRLSEQETPGEASAVEPLADRLQDLMLKFETEHPQLTTVLNQVSSALANLGI